MSWKTLNCGSSSRLTASCLEQKPHLPKRYEYFSRSLYCNQIEETGQLENVSTLDNICLKYDGCCVSQTAIACRLPPFAEAAKMIQRLPTRLFRSVFSNWYPKLKVTASIAVNNTSRQKNCSQIGYYSVHKPWRPQWNHFYLWVWATILSQCWERVTWE